MIKLFYGEDRMRAKQAIEEFLGQDYEIIEGKDLTLDSLPSVFLGQSLFSSSRQILIRDISENKPIFEEVAKYLNTPHCIILFELKLDKRSSAFKSLKGQIEIKEFPLPKDPNLSLVFNIFATAKKDGQKAVKMLEKIQHQEDPIMFFGLLVSQALKDYNQTPSAKTKKVLKELSKLDLDLKSSKLSSWLLLELFLLRLSSL